MVSGFNLAMIVVWGDSGNEILHPFKDDSRRVESRLLPFQSALLGFILRRRWIRTSSESKAHGLRRRPH